MPKRYVVRLSEEERQELPALVSIGKAAAYKIKPANPWLKMDVNGQGWTDEEAATALSCDRHTVANLRQRLVAQGLVAALARKPRQVLPRQRVCAGARQWSRNAERQSIGPPQANADSPKTMRLAKR